MALKVLPYKFASQSAKNLARTLGTVRVKADSETYINRQRNTILNWGSSTLPQWHNSNNEPTAYYNHPDNVAFASNKLTTLQMLSAADVPTVEWTDRLDVAMNWFAEEYTVVERTLLNSHSGGGIIIYNDQQNDEQWENLAISRSRLFTKYHKKRYEFRVHVLNNNVFDVQEKRRARAVDHNAVESLVRSHANGWVFCRDGLPRQDDDVFWHELYRIAKLSISALGLDFGAVDIIYNERFDEFRVLEVNTAVGLEGQTLNNYVAAIRGAGWTV